MVALAEIKTIIQNQQLERQKLLQTEKIIEREINPSHILNLLAKPNVVVITGVRRCGKSVLSWNILKETKFAYINFDEEMFYSIKAQDLTLMLQAIYELHGSDVEFIILDEIQNIPGWELFVNKLRRSKKIIITGSNSNLLSGELASHLTGRHLDFQLFPFSFREFLLYKDYVIENAKKFNYSTEINAAMHKLLEEYITLGGFPEAYTFPQIPKGIFSDIVQKDVIARNRLKNPDALQALAKYLITNYTKEITYNKLKNIISIQRIETINKYISYLQSTYLFIILNRFSYKLKEQIIAPKKVYCIDTGMIRLLAFKSMEEKGKLMENLVCIELFRIKNYSSAEYEIYYFKDHQQREVDFVIKEGTAISQLIQVCYEISEPLTKEREIKALLKASEELNCENLIVITWDYENEEIYQGKKIKFIILWKWLLKIA